MSMILIAYRDANKRLEVKARADTLPFSLTRFMTYDEETWS